MKNYSKKKGVEDKKVKKKTKTKMTDEEYESENYKTKIKLYGYDFLLKKTQDDYNKHIIISESWYLIKEIYNYTIKIMKNKKKKNYNY